MYFFNRKTSLQANTYYSHNYCNTYEQTWTIPPSALSPGCRELSMTTARRRIRRAQLPRGSPGPWFTLAQSGVLQSTFCERTSGFGLDREMSVVKIFPAFPFANRHHLYVIIKAFGYLQPKLQFSIRTHQLEKPSSVQADNQLQD